MKMNWTIVVVAGLSAVPPTLTSIAALVAALSSRKASTNNGKQIAVVKDLVNGAKSTIDARLVRAIEEIRMLKEERMRRDVYEGKPPPPAADPGPPS